MLWKEKERERGKQRWKATCENKTCARIIAQKHLDYSLVVVVWQKQQQQQQQLYKETRTNECKHYTQATYLTHGGTPTLGQLHEEVGGRLERRLFDELVAALAAVTGRFESRP